MIHIQSFCFNPFQENTYIVYDNTSNCVIIDPGCNNDTEQNILLDYILKNKLKPVKLLNTHCHLDHICGNAFVAKQFNLKLEAHAFELPVLEASDEVGKMYGFTFTSSPSIYTFIEKDAEITFGNSVLKVLFTPGHSPGSICFYNEENALVIAGDTLFNMSIGRTDLPGGNYQTLIDSIKNELFSLPPNTKVYSGHGHSTSIGFEKTNNPFFN